MSGNNVIFDDKNINKGNFYRNKILFQIDNSDVNKIHISEKASYGKEKKKSFKHFTGYNDNNDIRPLCVKPPQMIGYAKYFDSNKTLSFKVSGKKLFKKYTKIGKKLAV